MAPTKSLSLKENNRISTRSNAVTLTSAQNAVRNKRKAEGSPLKDSNLKRLAFCELTNGIALKNTENVKKTLTKKVSTIVKTKHVKIKQQNENLAPPRAPVSRMQTRASLRNNVPNETIVKAKEVKNDNNLASKKKTRLSNEFEKSNESLYSTALEDITSSSLQSNSSRQTKSNSSSPATTKYDGTNVTFVTAQMERQLNLGNHEVPTGVANFDKENWDDVFQISHYAMDIFNYLKEREALFKIDDYIDRQVCLTRWMRSLLVDWMVEIQESFELNHETLYLGVKLVDLYLSKMIVAKETLQLVGAASMFIASKFDERMPPLVDDFLYICDGAYSRRELIRMEINVLKVCDFNLGIPLSYRFLRRYARCAKVTMPILTLARFILEYALMDYHTVMLSDSKLAAAALYLALQMKRVSGWTKTLQFYTGYELNEILSIVHLLNNGLHGKPKEKLMTIRNKYSHKIFYEVANIPLMKNEDLKP